jgi:HSP20 family molecular chaperone IbpA
MATNALTKKEEKRTELSVPERIRDTVTYSPRCDIVETDEELILFADLPGVRPEDLDVRLENGQLEIYARCATRHEVERYLACEYGVGDYHRAFTISEAIDANNIVAELKNGVLTVHLPKSEAVKPKRIAIKAS